MQQVIYVDVLIVLNLFISFALLLATEFFTKEKGTRWRVFLGSFVGGLYSLQVFLPEMGVLFNVCSRIFAGLFITYVAFGFKTYKRFLKLFSVFLLMTFLFAGLMIALWIVFKPGGMLINNSTVYFGISLPVLVISTAACYVITRIISKIIFKNKPQQTIFDFTVEVDGKELSGRAMLDTGNTLAESFSGYPAVVCTYEFLKEFLPDETENFFQGNVTALNEIRDEKWKKRVRLVTFSTVSDTGVMPSFRPDKLVLKNSLETDKVFVSVTNRKKYINESFDMLLNPNLF